MKGRRGEERREKKGEGLTLHVCLLDNCSLHENVATTVYTFDLKEPDNLITLPLHHDNMHTPSHDTQSQFRKQTGLALNSAAL